VQDGGRERTAEKRHEVGCRRAQTGGDTFGNVLGIIHYCSRGDLLRAVRKRFVLLP